ncbi:MAG: lipopolysaccharide biosynthesis protein [Thermodesulfobacteriota bacterium]
MTTKTDAAFSLRKHLVRGAAGSLFIKVSTTLLTMAMAVVLARVLGVEGFGIYAFCLSVIQVLTVPAMLGGQLLLVRDVAAYKSGGEFGFLRGLLLYFRRANLLVSAVLALAAAAVAMWVYPDSRFLAPFLIAVSLILLLSGMQLQGAALRGLHHVLLGQTAQMLRPVLVMGMVAAMSVFWDGGLRPADAVWAQVASTGILVASFHVLLYRMLPRQVLQARPAYEASRWCHSMLPLVLAGSMQILNKETAVVLLGAMQGPENVALFRVAQRAAMLIPFGLQAVNMAIAPTVAELFSKKEKQRLQRLISKSMLAVLAFALPVALGLVLGGTWLIPLVFGKDYAAAYWPMVILCTGQLVNAGMGSVGLILNMGGRERLTAIAVAIAAVVNVVLNVILIPVWGAAGAALATSAGLLVWNVVLAVWLYRDTGIVSVFRPRLLR